MSERKPILLVDDSKDSQIAIELFNQKSIDYVEYHIDKFGGGCCGGGGSSSDSSNDSSLSKINAPAVFAPEGVFRGLDGVKTYFNLEKRYYESESAYW
jgi:hypothetical protein